MPHCPPLTLSPDDKLDILRDLDEFRFWRSLDDERRCTRCHEIITGRQVLVLERPGTRGRMRLQCPTPACASAASEWVYLDPVLIAAFKNAAATSGFSRRENARTGSAKHRQSGNASRKTARRRPSNLFRAALARLPVLRSLATGFHSFHPVAWGALGLFLIFNSGPRFKTGVQR
jgi:hypothetical protein